MLLVVSGTQENHLGHPVSVLLGHTAPVSFMDFCSCIPEALLSSSLDGTCRIWNAREGGPAVHVLTATAVFGPTRGLTRFGGGQAGGTNGVATRSGAAAVAGLGPGLSSQRQAASAAETSGDEAQPGNAYAGVSHSNSWPSIIMF